MEHEIPMRQNPASDPSELVELMRRYASGDNSAYRRLMLRVLPALRNFIRRRVSDMADADDLVQTVLIRIHRGRARFEAGPETVERNVINWFLTIAKFVLADHYQFTSRRPEESSGELDATEDLTSDIENPEHALLELERARAHERSLWLALGALPAKHRELVVLHKIRGVPMNSLATRLGIRPGTLRVRAHRAYRSIAQQIRRQHRFDTEALDMLGAVQRGGNYAAS